jgi:hypothetical protein
MNINKELDITIFTILIKLKLLDLNPC